LSPVAVDVAKRLACSLEAIEGKHPRGDRQESRFKTSDVEGTVANLQI
jgi:hypothetical protein